MVVDDRCVEPRWSQQHPARRSKSCEFQRPRNGAWQFERAHFANSAWIQPGVGPGVRHQRGCDFRVPLPCRARAR